MNPTAPDQDALERPLFFDGQQLYADNLQGLEAHHRALRRLHNRSLHQPGVGSGLAVAGRRGEREVRIQPGYALDAAGRELLLGEPVTEPVPPVAGEPDGGPAHFDLAVSHPADEDLEETETRVGVCAPRGAVRLREHPRLDWVRLRPDPSGELLPVDDAQRLALQNGQLIALGRAAVRDCRLDADVSRVLRRTARPPQRPRVRCGSASVTWLPWYADPDDVESALLGLRTEDPVGTGGLPATPCYTARVEGCRPLVLSGGADEQALVVLDGPAYVQDPTPWGFVCCVPLLVYAGQLGLISDKWLKHANALWRVMWYAIEE
ncbi:hypothetical protein ACYBSK_23350 [Streptomyces sp. BYX5S]